MVQGPYQRLPGDIARAVMAQISRKRSMVDTAVPAQGLGDANNEGQLPSGYVKIAIENDHL